MLTKQVLDQVNSNIKGERYSCVGDAKLILNTEFKCDIKDDPALRYFEAGVNKDGYWTNSHVKIQIEDLTDCLRVLFPTFDFTFLFDQSSGHCKVRVDGLIVSNMNVSYGGCAANMRDTLIKDVGIYNHSINIGDTQKMTFREEDYGPFWMDILEANNSKNDITTPEVITKERNKIELLKELRISGADTTSRRYLKPELVQMCKDRNIPTDITNPVVIPGWLNKPKGMLQILYERGYINKELVTKPSRMRYSKNGKKNDYEHDKKTLKSTCKQYLLTHLLSKCADFKEQKTDI